jgi:TorA maturation chaperone TorD
VSRSPRSDEGIGLADLAEVRQATYRLFGSLLLSPAGEERSRTLASDARQLRARSDLVSSFPLYPSWRGVLDDLLGTERSQLEEEHVRLFQLGGPSLLCPPYESTYLDASGFDRGALLVRVERAYAQAGVELGAGERADHIGLELQFLSLLCEDEATAWLAHDPEEASAALRRQQAFLDGHLLRWLHSFVRGVREVADEAGFYRSLAVALRAFVLHDRDLVEAMIDRQTAVSLGA